MIMKQYLIAFALMLTLSATTTSAAPKHRHHTPPTAVAKPDTTQADEGVEAYSDTTSTVADTVVLDSANQYSQPGYNSYDDRDWEESLVEKIIGDGFGVGGALLAICIVLAVLIFLLAPFIVLALILRYLIRRHNDRVMLAQKAMETGQPIPEPLQPVDKQTDEYLWRRGVRNVAIGLGLALMFSIWDADALAGVGLLILCYGAGQMFLGRTGRKKNQNDKPEF